MGEPISPREPEWASQAELVCPRNWEKNYTLVWPAAALTQLYQKGLGLGRARLMSHFKRSLVSWEALFPGCLISLPRTRERKKPGRGLGRKPSHHQRSPGLTLGLGAQDLHPFSSHILRPFPRGALPPVPCAPYTLCCFSEEPHRLS